MISATVARLLFFRGEKFKMQFPTLRLTIASIAALVGMISTPTAVYAQEFAIEEITVTARKRAESLQDIPLSITAFTAETLRQRNIANIYELSAATPNFVTTPQLGRRLDRPTIRGQSGANRTRLTSLTAFSSWAAQRHRSSTRWNGWRSYADRSLRCLAVRHSQAR